MVTFIALTVYSFVLFLYVRNLQKRFDMLRAGYESLGRIVDLRKQQVDDLTDMVLDHREELATELGKTSNRLLLLAETAGFQHIPEQVEPEEFVKRRGRG